jgi:dipeptidyl aminopeptidase/acylaminoacyl peptidase
MISARAVQAARRVGTSRLARAVPALLLALPLPVLGQASQQQKQATTWQDQLIQQETYAKPPQEILDAVMAPRHLNVTLSNLSPDKKWFLNEIGDGPVRMDLFSKPFHDLGGEFIDFKANRDRGLTIRSNVGIQIISAEDGSKRTIQVPPGARVSNATWSPDGKSVAYFVHGDDATHIWIADAATGKSRQLTRTPVLATFVSSFDWSADGKKIETVLIPDMRKPMPPEPAQPAGPRVKVAEESDKNRLRTYASLMSTPYDQDLLEWHGTGQIAAIDVATRAVTKFGQPTMARTIDFSPDGQYVRVTRMVRPFSYVVPVANFGTVEEIWDATGKVLTKLSERKLNLGVNADDPVAAPGAGGGGQQNQQGRREVTWRTDGQGLSYLEQEAAPPGQDTADAAPAGGRGGRAGGQGNGPRRRDRLYQWLPPFDSGAAKVLYEQDTRMASVRFSPDMQAIFFRETAGQNTSENAVYLNAPTQKYTLARWRSDDIYADPGTIAMARGGAGGGGFGGGGGGRGGGPAGGGTVLVSSDGSSVYFQGTQYDKNPLEVGPKAFLDKVNIRSGQKQRVFEGSNSGVFERVSSILDPDATRLIVARESPTQVPQQFLKTGGQEVQLTQNVDPTPDLTRARRESFTVERPDGFKFRVNVMLPTNYQQGVKPPAMFWFYPREFAGQEEYDRGARTFNKNTFQSFGIASLQFLARLGYAVVEPDAPIVGAAGEMNNNYENDLRNNLSAVIDELDRRGLADRTRIGIGGHSYGAFSTVNALVHTPFFKAGIAGDGAYNRTLTPLGFQTERRDFWQAKDVYLSMSPFIYANNLSGALLMYHGLHDQNVGTDPINSPRLFHALNGLGKTVSMYLYPFEDHGPAALETRLDLWARWTAWLDKYVKNPTKTETKVTTEDKPISNN